MKIKKTRKEAAKELNDLFNSYEVRHNKLTTTYKKIYFDSIYERWRLIGVAHNYSC